MKTLKNHLKLKNKPICGSRGTIKFARLRADVTCKNCLRAIES